MITAGSFDILAEAVVSDDDHLLRLISQQIRSIDGISRTETFLYLKLAKQTYNWAPDEQTSRRRRRSEPAPEALGAGLS